MSIIYWWSWEKNRNKRLICILFIDRKYIFHSIFELHIFYIFSLIFYGMYSGGKPQNFNVYSNQIWLFSFLKLHVCRKTSQSSKRNKTKQRGNIQLQIGNGETGLCICCYWKYKLVQSFLSKIFDRMYQNLRLHDVMVPFLGFYPPAILTRE